MCLMLVSQHWIVVIILVAHWRYRLIANFWQLARLAIMGQVIARQMLVRCICSALPMVILAAAPYLASLVVVIKMAVM